MIEPLLLLLMLLQVKHWYVDFVDQSDAEIASKGIYGDQLGVNHSTKHAIGTMLCVVAIAGLEYILLAIMMALMDFILHYHIDYVKMQYGNNNIKDKQFWIHMGADQLAHQLTYLFIIWMVFA